MPTKFRLTPKEVSAVITFLYEPFGYLDAMEVAATGETGTAALAADPTLEIDEWVYAVIGPDNFVERSCAVEAALHWWIQRENREANNQGPPAPRRADWLETLDGLVTNIDNAFFRTPLHVRDDTGNPRSLFDANRLFIGTARSGTFLALQARLFGAVLAFFDE